MRCSTLLRDVSRRKASFQRLFLGSPCFRERRRLLPNYVGSVWSVGFILIQRVLLWSWVCGADPTITLTLRIGMCLSGGAGQEEGKEGETTEAGIGTSIETKENAEEERQADAKRIEVGYGWRFTLSDFASLSGVFAGFSIAFIILLVGLERACVLVADLGIVLMGIAAALFVAASQFFLQAKNCDLRTLPKEYVDFLSKELSEEKITFEAAALLNDNKILYYEKRGRYCYNLGVWLMLVGFGLVVASYNMLVGFIVLCVAVPLEIYQHLIIH